MNKQSKTPIPWEYLLLMSTHEVTIHGVKVTAYVANCETLLRKHIANFRRLLDTTTAKVVGLDSISFNDKMCSYINSRSRKALILCVYPRCLIVHLDYDIHRKKAPESLDNFLNDPNICFVGITSLPSSPNLGNFSNVDNVGVSPGDLADMVLRNSALFSSNIAHLSEKLGFTFEPSKLIKYHGVIDKFYTNYLTVFTDNDIIIAAASNAYAYYQIGFKLLSSLQKDTNIKPGV